MHPQIDELISWAGRVLRIAGLLKHALLLPLAIAAFGVVSIVVALSLLGAPIPLVVIAGLATLIPVWRLWSFRQRVREVENVPEQLRDLADIDDDLRPRLDAVVASVTDEGTGVVRVFRTLRSLIQEGRGALGQEFKPVQDLVSTFHPARLAEAWAAMLFAGAGAVVGAILLLIAFL